MHDEYAARSAGLHVTLRVLDRQKWVILLVLVVTPAMAFFFSRETPLYRATAEMIFERQTLATTLTGLAGPSSSRPIETQAELAHELGIAAEVVQRAGVPGTTADGLLAASSVAAKNDVDGLVFSVTDASPGVAERLATAYAEQFAVYRRQVDGQLFAATRRLLSAQLATLRASGDVGSPLYKGLVEKQQLIDTAQALYASDILITKPARGATKLRPKPVRNGVLALGLGIMLAVGLALVREALDTRVRSTDELVEPLGLPLLARIPRLPFGRRFRRRRQLNMLEHPASAHAEAIRLLRLSLDATAFLNERRSTGSIIQLTSAVAGEGKSTTSADLAISFARSGRRVILMDLDVRRPSIAQLFELGPGLGVTDVVLRGAAIDDAIVRVPVGSLGAPSDVPAKGGRGADAVLEVIPAGATPADVEGFVSSERLAAVFDELRARVDIVLVDAPPLIGIGDAIELSSASDAIVLVSRLGVTRRTMISELRRLLEICRAPKLGVVVVGASVEGEYYNPHYHVLPSLSGPAPSQRGDRLENTAAERVTSSDRAAAVDWPGARAH